MTVRDRIDPLAHALRAGALYFFMVYAVGWVLGPLRTLLLEPQIGKTLAVLLEMPIILLASFVIARWVVRKMTVSPKMIARLLMGATALALLVAAELIMAFALSGRTMADYIVSDHRPEAILFLASACLFALLPGMLACVERRR